MRAVPLISCLVALAAAPSALAAKRGHVGGAPTRSPILKLELHAVNPTTPPTVIGRGRGAGGRIELIGFKSKARLCIIISRPRLLRIGNAQGLGCGNPPHPAIGALELQNTEAEWSKGHGW